MLSKAQQLLNGRRGTEDERLLRLFWNRAELKREFDKLRRERDRMVEHLRQQEGATLRVQQRLEQLEGLLADPLRSANASVYYQLRGIWQYGRRRLSRLARDVAARQQDLEQRREQARFEDNRQVALDAIDRRLAALQERQQALEAQLAELGHRRSGLAAFWRYLERRQVEMEEESARAALDDVAIQMERYARARHEKLVESLSPLESLSVEGRRAVNLAVLALAQEMILHFSTDNVAAMARDASLRTVTDVAYGGLDECRDLSQRIATVLSRFEALPDLPARVQRRTDWLAQTVRFTRPEDTVPASGYDSIPVEIPASPVAGRSATLAVNVVADEYWDIYTVLMT
jgi:hypothetical protein